MTKKLFCLTSSLGYDNLTIRKIKDNSYKSRKITKRCLVIEKSGGGEKQLVGRVGMPKGIDFKAVCSNFMAKIEFDNTVDVSFMNYIFYSLYSNNQNFPFVQQTTGIQNLNVGYYLTTKVLLPPKNEQEFLAEYLDKACEKIENTISIKEQQIDEIDRYYHSLIYEAVTKGLNKNTDLENSDIEWIGKYPKHWDIKRLFNICSFIRGSSTFGKNDLLEHGKYVALQYGKTYKVKEINEQFQFYVNDEFYKSSQVVNYGDTIFVSTSETMEDLGHSVFYNREDIGLIGGEQILLKPNKNILDEKYLFYSSKVFGKGLKKFATGIKVFRFDIYDLKTIYTPIPPIKEQIEISNYLETTSLKISSMKKNIESQIQTLKDYRKSLIFECVTGKKQIYKGEI